MQRKSYQIVSIFLLLALLSGGRFFYAKVYAADQSRSAILEKNKQEAGEAEALYQHVWRLISEDYYDQEYGGQDWNRWQHKYDNKLANADDAHLAIATMLTSLGDRYTRFLDHDAFDDERSQIDAKLCGIGVQIGVDKNHRIIIISPLEGTPAFSAGVLANDEIAAINGQPTKGFSVEEAAKQIRGPADTNISLTLMRGKRKLILSMKRAEISIKAVQTVKMLDSSIGYVRLSSFISQQANQEMHDALQKLSPAKGIILDLRDNPGGLLTNAIDITNMFLTKGNIVSTVDRDGYKTITYSEGKPLCRQPLVVLVNKSSASASEITCGALKDNGRAIIVGQTTFGKGLVQGINRLEDGTGVNVTIAKYLTPNDTDINKKGIAPDVSVPVSDKEINAGVGPWWEDAGAVPSLHSFQDTKDIQLKTALRVLKQKVNQESPLALRAQAIGN